MILEHNLTRKLLQFASQIVNQGPQSLKISQIRSVISLKCAWHLYVKFWTYDRSRLGCWNSMVTPGEIMEHTRHTMLLH